MRFEVVLLEVGPEGSRKQRAIHDDPELVSKVVRWLAKRMLGVGRLGSLPGAPLAGPPYHVARQADDPGQQSGGPRPLLSPSEKPSDAVAGRIDPPNVKDSEE